MDNNDNKKVVNVSTKKEVVVQKPKVEDFDTSKSLEEHMKENQENVKTKIDYKTIITYVIMSIIVIVCILLLVHFCEASMNSLNKNKTTTNLNYQLVPTSTKGTDSIEYVRPSTVPTAATHTIFGGNKTNPPSTKQPDRTNNASKHTTVATKAPDKPIVTPTEKTTESTEKPTETTKPTESTKPTEESTEPTTEKNDDNSDDSENNQDNEEVGDR